MKYFVNMYMKISLDKYNLFLKEAYWNKYGKA